MMHKSVYADSEAVARLIDRGISSSNYGTVGQVICDKSMSELFIVTLKAVYLKRKGYCYGTEQYD